MCNGCCCILKSTTAYPVCNRTPLLFYQKESVTNQIFLMQCMQLNSKHISKFDQQTSGTSWNHLNFFFLYPPLYLTNDTTFLCFTSLCSTSINIYSMMHLWNSIKTNKTVHVEKGSTFEAIIFRKSCAVLYKRDRTGPCLLEGDGGRKAMFSGLTPKGRGFFNYVNTREQTERHTHSWTINCGLISIKRKENRIPETIIIFNYGLCMGQTKNYLHFPVFKTFPETTSKR